MSLRHRQLVAVIALAVVACGGETSATTEPAPAPAGASSPTEAVDQLITAINEPNFDEASRLAMPGQAALASLAEGATFGAVAMALRDGDDEIASNFWSGFAQGTESFLSGDVQVSDDGVVNSEGVEFHNVQVQPAAGGNRSVMVREEDGYRIDLFASFGAGLADKMIGPTERLLATQTDDARLIVSNLRQIVPSLLVAAQLPGTSGEVSQQLLALVEVITRAG